MAVAPTPPLFDSDVLASGSPNSAETGARVELRGLRKEYGHVTAVAQIDLTVESGEFITLLGPSGSGKTTIMLMIAGFVDPTEGQILVNDREISGVSPEHRNIGMVFQHYALFPHMTVSDNIAFPLKMRRWQRDRISAAVHEALNIVRLDAFADRYPRQLSGGQQQRVALARALVYRPPVLLMDEPLGALDKKLREGLQIEIKQIQEQLGLTVIYVTHDQSEALTMSDRVAIMSEGRILQMGTPEELYQRPVSRFVADFLGDSNFLSGTIIDGGTDNDVVETPTGLRFLASHQHGSLIGDQVECALRLEHLMLNPVEGSLDNAFMGRIVEQIYTGELTKMRVMLPTGETVSLSLQNRSAALKPRDGTTVSVGWSASDVVIVDRQPL